MLSEKEECLPLTLSPLTTHVVNESGKTAQTDYEQGYTIVAVGNT